MKILIGLGITVIKADIFNQIETEKVSINRVESTKVGFDHVPSRRSDA